MGIEFELGDVELGFVHWLQGLWGRSYIAECAANYQVVYIQHCPPSVKVG